MCALGMWVRLNVRADGGRELDGGRNCRGRLGRKVEHIGIEILHRIPCPSVKRIRWCLSADD